VSWSTTSLARRDRRRCAAIEADGYRIVHVDHDDVVRRPEQTVCRVRDAIEERTLTVYLPFR
jgi:hypothetical protein